MHGSPPRTQLDFVRCVRGPPAVCEDEPAGWPGRVCHARRASRAVPGAARTAEPATAAAAGRKTRRAAIPSRNGRALSHALDPQGEAQAKPEVTEEIVSQAAAELWTRQSKRQPSDQAQANEAHQEEEPRDAAAHSKKRGQFRLEQPLCHPAVSSEATSRRAPSSGISTFHDGFSAGSELPNDDASGNAVAPEPVRRNLCGPRLLTARNL